MQIGAGLDFLLLSLAYLGYFRCAVTGAGLTYTDGQENSVIDRFCWFHWHVQRMSSLLSLAEKL